MIDISKIKPGDKVTLGPFEVTRRDATSGYVSVWIGGGNCAFNDDQIAAHHPAPRGFQVGDMVRGGTTYGVIEHVARGRARVLWDEETDELVYCDRLTLVGAGQ